jgi:hypothetical protein
MTLGMGGWEAGTVEIGTVMEILILSGIFAQSLNKFTKFEGGRGGEGKIILPLFENR